MGAFETLKEELKLQKQAIETKGGVVSVANDYPSPSEITAGIYTTTGKDLSDATATVYDVLLGKTFYAGDETLKVGELEVIDQTQIIKELIVSADATTTQVFTFEFPAGVKSTQKNLFRDNTRTANIYLNDELLIINDYAFCESENFTFPNFNQLQNLKTINQYAFYGCVKSGIDFTNLPNVTTIQNYAFYDCVVGNALHIPGSVTTLGNYAFARLGRRFMETFSFGAGFSATSLPSNFIGGSTFNCDIRIPDSVTKLSSYAFHGSSFLNITVPATCTTLQNSSFGASTTESAENFNLKTITFESETTPRIDSSIIANQHITNGIKIYVPDVSVEAYKALSGLSKCIDRIYPISQKE